MGNRPTNLVLMVVSLVLLLTSAGEKPVDVRERRRWSTWRFIPNDFLYFIVSIWLISTCLCVACYGRKKKMK